MRRQDREAIRDKSQEPRRSTRESAMPEFEKGRKDEQMRGRSDSADQDRQSSPHPSGRMPLPD